MSALADRRAKVSYPEAQAQLAAFMQQHGLRTDGLPTLDGERHYVQVEGNRGREKSGAYLAFYEGARPAGVVWNYKTGLKTTWKADGELVSISPEAMRLMQARANADKAARAKQQQGRQDAAAHLAERLLAGSRPADGSHPYLVAKGIGPHGLRVAVQGQTVPVMRESGAVGRVSVAGRLLMPLRDIEGALCNVQTISEDGRKLFLGGAQKLGTFHLIGGPVKADRPLWIAEGFATGATIHEATGDPVVVAQDTSNLGPVSRLLQAAHPKVEIAFAADNDAHLPLRPPPHTLPNAGKVKADEAARQIGARVLLAPALPGRTDAGRGTDWNDLAAARGLDAARETLRLSWPWRMNGQHGHSWTRLPPYHPFITEPRQAALDRQTDAITTTIILGSRIGAARREVVQRRTEALALIDNPSPGQKGAVTRRFIGQVAHAHGFGKRIPAPPSMFVSGSQGTGKTFMALEVIVRLRERICAWVTAPSIKKCRENLADYRNLAEPGSLPPMLVLGMGWPDATRPGRMMCQRYEVAKTLVDQGISIKETLCKACPFRDACGYREQEAQIAAMNGVGVFFLANASLFVNAMAPTPVLVVADERLDPVTVQDVPFAAFDPNVIPRSLCPSETAWAAMRDRLTRTGLALIHPNPLEVLRRDGILKSDLRDVVRVLAIVANPDVSGLTGDLSDDEVARRLEAIKPDPRAGYLLAVLRAVLREYSQPRGILHGVTFSALAQSFTVSSIRPLMKVAKAAALVLDGTGDHEMNRAIFGTRLQHVQARVERDAHTTGTTGRLYSTVSLTGRGQDGEQIPSKIEPSAKLRAEICTIAERQPGPCLVVATMAVEDALDDMMARDQPMTHFGALRGLNNWQECPAAFVVGMMALKIHDLEAYARAYLVTDPQPFHSFADIPVDPDYGYRDCGWLHYATFMRRMRDGSVSPCEVPIHPDPRVQRIYEQLRDADVTQAPDRTRPIFNRRKIVLGNPLVLDMTYDAILTHRQLVAGGSTLDLVFADLGILPFGGRDLHLCWEGKGKFRSEGAAAKCLKSLSLSPPHSPRLESYQLGGGLCRRVPLPPPGSNRVKQPGPDRHQTARRPTCRAGTDARQVGLVRTDRPGSTSPGPGRSRTRFRSRPAATGRRVCARPRTAHPRPGATAGAAIGRPARPAAPPPWHPSARACCV